MISETTAYSALTFLLGLVVGNWLAIGRDRRKEFNDAVIPIRTWLLKEIPKPSLFVYWPSDHEFDLFFSCLSACRSKAFQRHLAAYRIEHAKAIVQDPKTGSTSYRNDTALKEHLSAMLPFTDRR